MNKRGIIEQLKKQFNCDEYEAKQMFIVGLKNGHIEKHINWNKIISFFIFWTVVLTGLWASYRALL